jgi:hypothetical protein
MRLAAMVRPERRTQMGKKKNVAEETPAAEITTNETQPETGTATEPVPEAEPPKKGRKKKAAKLPSGNATLADVSAAYLADLADAGRSNGTIASYGMELKTAMNELGEATPISEITPEKVGEFFNSKRVTKLRSGRNKSQLSIDKTRRVLRLALVWAAERGIIAQAPIPEPTPAK